MNYIDLDVQLNKLKNDEMHISFFVDFAIENIRKEPEVVKEALDKAMKIAQNNKFEFAYSCCLIYIGWYHYYRLETDLAIQNHLLAYNLLLDLDDKKTLMRACNALMSDYLLLGAFDIGIEYGLQAIEMSNTIDDTDMRTRLLINTATAYSLGEYYQSAIDMMNSLLDVQYEISIVDRLLIYNILGEAYYNIEEYTEGYSYSIRALQLIEENNLEYYEPEILLSLAPTEFKLGKYQEAINSFEKAIDKCEKYNNMNTKVNLLLRWAICDISMNQYINAKLKLEDAITEAKKTNSNLILSMLYVQLAKACNLLEQYKDAYEFVEKAREYDKLVYSKNNSLWFAKLNAYKIEEETKVYKELYDKMNTISKIGKSLTTKLNLSDILSSIYYEVKNLLKADCLAVALYNEDEKRLDYELYMENNENFEGWSTLIDDETSIGAFAVRNKVDILINDFDNEYKKYVPEYLLLNKGVEKVPQSLIYCPLIKNGKMLGVITIQNYQKNAYNLQDLSTLDLLVSYIVIAIDNAKLFNEVEFLATHDHLTGTINRREILRLGEANVEANIDNTDLSIIIIDVDFFKLINDKFGHSVGDDVLIQVSKMINEGVRNTDYVGRYGGEEFLLVLPNTNATTAKIIGERIRKNIESYQFVINNKVKTKLSISLGLFEFNNKDISFYEGIKNADLALYRAKELGRNRLIEYRK
ncbi:MAG: ggdef domain protein [Clostridiales bacterium]|jgi:diguanylate cyclase (GGDEF)-like protein|nr:ggdef domain protein [Clostridiales bacterium]